MNNEIVSKPIISQKTPTEQIPSKTKSESSQRDNYNSFWADLFALASKPLNPKMRSSSVLTDKTDLRNALPR
jgi:hypothetical protein